jgi:hypothetical protein
MIVSHLTSSKNTSLTWTGTVFQKETPVVSTIGVGEMKFPTGGILTEHSLSPTRFRKTQFPENEEESFFVVIGFRGKVKTRKLRFRENTKWRNKQHEVS